MIEGLFVFGGVWACWRIGRVACWIGGGLDGGFRVWNSVSYSCGLSWRGGGW